jgi:hypothetical protein
MIAEIQRNLRLPLPGAAIPSIVMSRNQMKKNKILVVKGVQLYIDTEKDKHGTWISISSDGYYPELIQPLIDHLISLQDQDDLEVQNTFN